MKINIWQRIVLIVGALALMAVLANMKESQQYDYVHSFMVTVLDWKAALFQSAIVIVATGAVFFAVGKRKE